MTQRFRNLIGAAALALAAGSPLNGQAAENPPSTQTATPAEAQDVADNFAFEKAKGDRLTVPVSIDGKGPYRFLVDTGAERTVISEELAIPEQQMFVCGMSLGYADPSRIENSLVTDREVVSNFTTFHETTNKETES